MSGLPADAKAQAEQVRSISVERVGSLVGHLAAALLTDLGAALGRQVFRVVPAGRQEG